MPDTPSPKAALDATAKALQLLKDAWPGADADASPPAAAPEKPKNEEAETGAARARRKYDKTLRWVLAVFSAVGLLVFGSVPFTDLGHVDPLLLLLSLGAVGLGLAVIILATATGLEMQDASLGELAQTFERRSRWRWFHVLTPWRRPQVVANRDLKAIIESTDVAEAQAHLGPGVSTVGELVQRIGEIERAAMAAYIGWDGDWLPRQGDQQAAVDPTRLQAAVDGSVAATLARADLAHQELDRLTKALATLREQLPTEKDVAPDAHLVREIERLSGLLVSAAAAVPAPDYLAAAARSTALDELRDHYRAHRTMVLQESLVAQIRAKFRTALCWLLLGAVLTGGGGITYAYAVANPTTDGSVDNPVAVTLTKDEAAYTTYAEKKCWDGEAGALIAPALLTSSSDADGRQDGDFTFLPLAGPCAGETFDVDEGEGTYVAWSEPAEDEDPAEEPGAKKPRIGARVNVTILPDTPAYAALGDCRTRPADVTGVTARLLGANDADDDQDGPFTVVLLAGQCAARTVFVREADGRYRLLEDPEPAATTDE